MMMCQNCGKNPATTHIKTIVNGTLTEYDLCSECARERGYTNFFKDMSFDFGNLLGGFIGTPTSRGTAVRCPKCGASFAEITESGKIGCAECYKVFHDRLMPTIHRIHGTAKHKGKVPGTSALRIVEPAGKIAVVEGVPKLTGAPVRATDLRAGAAVVIAALMAEGTTEIANAHFIRRGYEKIDEKLRHLGAQVEWYTREVPD